MNTPFSPAHLEAPRASAGRAAALHLLPGWLTGLLYLPLGAALSQRNLPPVWALMGLCAGVLLPLEVWMLRRAGVPLDARLRPLDSRTWRVTLLTVLGAALLPGLALLLPLPALPGLPDLTEGLDTLNGFARTLTLLAWLLLFGLVGPAVEEAYFRGWLLGGLAPLGRWALPLHAALFAAYHLWQPGAWLRVLLFTLPLAWAFRRTGRRLPGLVAHVVVNLVAWIGVLRL